MYAASSSCLDQFRNTTGPFGLCIWFDSVIFIERRLAPLDDIIFLVIILWYLVHNCNYSAERWNMIVLSIYMYMYTYLFALLFVCLPIITLCMS